MLPKDHAFRIQTQPARQRITNRRSGIVDELEQEFEQPHVALAKCRLGPGQVDPSVSRQIVNQVAAAKRLERTAAASWVELVGGVVVEALPSVPPIVLADLSKTQVDYA